ncbi:gliding motility-associated protein GldC [Thermonema lapsum]|jgi:gliding motility-associated protein GldC|uniref:Gliding motility-associated protein GldC n=1 Tax=Thermonema lapsum TaxID=28195 RepID=A0A846MPF6_9BACT|nr:gliding motility protein GldC [Thermonema lapsum]NIK73404.1 gliding motility-associated protein GldC [Thermonema lapsum]
MSKRQESIQLYVTLDEHNVCESIRWEATQQPDDAHQDAKAFSLAIWDGTGSGTLKIDLWNKEMNVIEMKRFCIETIATMADTLRKATGDELMAMEIENCCKRLDERLLQEMRSMNMK